MWCFSDGFVYEGNPLLTWFLLKLCDISRMSKVVYRNQEDVADEKKCAAFEERVEKKLECGRLVLSVCLWTLMDDKVR